MYRRRLTWWSNLMESHWINIFFPMALSLCWPCPMMYCICWTPFRWSIRFLSRRVNFDSTFWQRANNPRKLFNCRSLLLFPLFLTPNWTSSTRVDFFPRGQHEALAQFLCAQGHAATAVDISTLGPLTKIKICLKYRLFSRMIEFLPALESRVARSNALSTFYYPRPCPSLLIVGLPVSVTRNGSERHCSGILCADPGSWFGDWASYECSFLGFHCEKRSRTAFSSSEFKEGLCYIHRDGWR